MVWAPSVEEIGAPNGPLPGRVPAVEGAAGGGPPFRRYVDLQTRCVPADKLSPDGRLREQLESIPPGRLLRLLGVEHVITDKGFDVWYDGAYYDLELSNRLESGQSVTIERADRLEATALGIFSHLEGADSLTARAPVAELTVVGPDREDEDLALPAGADLAAGHRPLAN